jgi:hypothetical protein
MITNFKLESNYFDDLPPSEKNCDELALLLLTEASGLAIKISDYSEQEIHRCASQLINKGFLRGTVIDKDKCIWSKPTKRGRFILEDWNSII